MTKDEIKKMVAYLRTYYPNFLEDADISMAVTAWHDIFKGEDKDIVAIATKNYVKTNKYPPTVAGILEQIDLIKNPQTDDELFSLIVKATKNGTYGAVEEFNKLPEECKAFVGSPSGLKDLALLDSGTMSTIVRGQFLKRVGSIKQHQTVQNGLPGAVRQAIASAKLLTEGVDND